MKKVCCKNCLKHRKLDLPYQGSYCKAYNKIISREHINDEIECEKYKGEEKHLSLIHI